MTCPDLAHFYAHSKGGGQRAHELTEIHPVLRGVIERCFFTVPLELDIRQLHVQAEAFDDVTRLFDRIRLAQTGLLPCIDVLLGRFAFDSLQFVVVLRAFGIHLGPDQLTCEADNSNIQPVICIQHDDIADMHLQRRWLAEEPFAVRLETNFNNVKRTLSGRQGDAFQPIEDRQRTTTIDSTIPIAPATAGFAVCSISTIAATHWNEDKAVQPAFLSKIFNRALMSMNTNLPLTFPAISRCARSSNSCISSTFPW